MQMRDGGRNEGWREEKKKEAEKTERRGGASTGEERKGERHGEEIGDGGRYENAHPYLRCLGLRVV